MKSNYDNKQWAVHDFQRYHAGDMPAAERHALEKAALDDPFLEDALEGYAYSAAPVEQMNELKRRLQPPPEREKAAIVWYRQKQTAQMLRVAAALILFAGLAWLIYPGQDNKPVEIAANNTTVEANRTTPSGTIPADSTAPSTHEANGTELPVLTAAPSSFPPLKNSGNEPKVLIAESRVSKEKSESETVLLAPAAPPLNRAALPNRESTDDAVAVQSNKATSSATAILIAGTVVDEKDKPVPFANLSMPGLSKSISTDAGGKFVISNTTTDQLVNVEVSANGFENTHMALAAGKSDNRIVLQESGNALSEVVVVGYGTTKKSAARKATAPEKLKSAPVNDYKVILKNGKPLESWEEFDRSIAGQRKNNEFVDSTGIVILSFDIDDKGAAQNISVVKKLCDACDEEAKRILQNAPAMKRVKAGKKVEAVIRFK